ncbi:hypothetical protein [Burkholderia sp. Ac-20379]|uniref:hypothetical protein n=1 Tax=Burkholderia sp. Ac-20379 TaxID=2703900 RepID=UPI00198217C9|nr:hypothetical protein [Burkholderia sp. Ac-20379]MBN3724237.1 hypothetical protein [Burkholderia sp. Ac-20379]
MLNPGLGSEEMLRLISLHLSAFLLSFTRPASIKAFAMIFVAYFYGGEFLRVKNDTKLVLANGTLLGLVFCIFVTAAFVRKNDPRPRQAI